MPPTWPTFTPSNIEYNLKEESESLSCNVNNSYTNKLRHQDLPPLRLSRTAIRKSKWIIRSGWAPSTIKGYKRSIKKFQSFCDREGIPQQHRTPTSEDLLIAFIADEAGHSSSSTASNRIAALRSWHLYNKWQWHGGQLLKKALAGFKAVAPSKSTRPQKQHITYKALVTINRNLKPDDPRDLAISACATTAFWGQCRLGELLPVRNNDFSTSTRPAKVNLKNSPHDPQDWELNLPSTKTDRQGQNILLLKQRGDPTDPIKALQKFLTSRASRSIPASAPLFSFLENDTTITLTKSVFLKRCNQLLESSGLPKCTGHSFRIGGTTHLLISNTPPDVVKLMGRWSSNAFLKYWRSLDQIAPLHAKNIAFRNSYNKTNNHQKMYSEFRNWSNRQLKETNR